MGHAVSDRTPEQALRDALAATRTHDAMVTNALEFRRQQLTRAIADGAEIKAIADGAGVARSTVYGWLEDRP